MLTTFHLPDRMRSYTLPLLQAATIAGYALLWGLGGADGPNPILTTSILTIAHLILLVQLRFTLQLDSHEDRWVWRMLVICAALWALSYLYQVGALALAGGQTPTPSLADLLLLAGFLAAVTGLGLYPTSGEQEISRLRDLLDAVILFLGSVLLFWIAVVKPTVESGVVGSVIVIWLAVAPAFGLTLVLLSFRLTLLARLGSRRSVMVMLMLAFIARVPSDLLHAYGLLFPGESQSAWASIGWLFSPAAITFAAAIRLRAKADQLRLPDWPRRGLLAIKIEALLPAIMAYLITGFTLVEWWLVGQPDWLAVVAAGIMLLLLVGRQGVIAGQAEVRQHAALLQAAADLAFVCSATGQFMLTNPAMEQATGVEGEGDGVYRLQDIMPEGQADRALETALAGGWSGEVVFQGPTGGFPVALSLRPLVDERQTEPLVAGTAHDLSELKKREAEREGALEAAARAREELQMLNASLESKVESRTVELAETVQRLEKMNEELQELDKLKSEFVTLVSHELRGPLTNIRSGVELALHRAEGVPGSIEETLQLVSSETERLTAFVEIILDLSALEAGRFPMEIQSIPLPVIVRAVAGRIPDGIGGDRIELKIPEDLPAVRGDERSLMSVLSHLLDNAIKYAPTGPITVRSQVDGDRIRVSVVDDGPGIPPQARDAVFERFRRLDSRDSRDIYGHGLGLHLSRRLVEAMGGQIVANESNSGGTEISFWLPIWDS